MKFNNTLTVACEVLECNGCDLERLEDVHENMEDILLELESMNIKPTYNSIMEMVFIKGVYRIQEALEDRIRELYGALELSRDELEELEELEQLDPETDIDIYIDGRANQVGMTYNTMKVYKKHLRDALDEFEHYTGYSLY